MDLRKTALGHQQKRSPLSMFAPQNFLPVKWDVYFDEKTEMTTDNGTFGMYKKGKTGPIILCLHGGGYSGLTWALFAKEIISHIDCQVIALDLRGHGNTSTNNDDDLSLQTLAGDVVDIGNKLSEELGVPIILVGHSMGGAVAVEATHSLDSVVGLCVIDVVEGTALDALSAMQSILRGRPKGFKSIQHAIQWCYKGGQTHNIEAAKVSMPGQIIRKTTKKLAAEECDTPEAQNPNVLASTSGSSRLPSISNPNAITEEADEDDSNKSASNNSCNDCGKPPLPKTVKTDFKHPQEVDVGQQSSSEYIWRIDLSKTEKFWTGWFQGMSQKFLDTRVPKVLLLANIYGLDTALTVGQMQGKFQMQVLSKSGHAIHEDQPQQVCDIISGYLVKQKLATPRDGYVFPPMPSC